MISQVQTANEVDYGRETGFASAKDCYNEVVVKSEFEGDPAWYSSHCAITKRPLTSSLLWKEEEIFQLSPGLKESPRSYMSFVKIWECWYIKFKLTWKTDGTSSIGLCELSLW